MNDHKKWWFYDHIFDIPDHSPGDDDDGNDNTEEHGQILEEYNQDFDFNYIYTNVDEEDMINGDDDTNTDVNEDQQVKQKYKYTFDKMMACIIDIGRANYITKIKSIVDSCRERPRRSVFRS
jgi:hypothetical protein